MGKYPPSKLHNWYSDWHWALTKEEGQHCYLSDIDRLWIEIRYEKGEGIYKLIAIMDIKQSEEKVTKMEEVAYDWFEAQKLPVYVIWIDIEKRNFIVLRWKTTTKIYFNESEYKEWIISNFQKIPGNPSVVNQQLGVF